MSIELQDRLYTSTQVADILGVSLRTLYRYMEDGRIQSMRTASGRHRFTKDQILDFLNANGGNNLPVYDDEPAMGQGANRYGQPTNNAQYPQQYGTMNQTPNQFGSNPVPNQYAGSSNLNNNQNSQFGNDNQFGPTKFAGTPMDQQTNPQNFNQYGQPVGQFQSPQPTQFNNTPNQFNQDTPYNQNLGQQNVGFNDFADEEEEEEDNFIMPSAPVANQFGSNNNLQSQTPNPYDFNRSDSLGAPQQPVAPVQPIAPVQNPQSGWGAAVPTQPQQQYQDFQAPVQQPENNYYQNNTNTGMGQNTNYGYEAPAQVAPRPMEEPQPVELRSNPNINIRYYRSDFTDLIDLAKRIKNAGLTRDLEYAFTLYAGASLHTPIDPFTILHFYGNPEDMQIWKDELRLSPVQKREDSNVGIIVNTDIVFVPTREIGGFKVVDDKILLKDLNNLNEVDLAAKLRKTFGVL